MHAQHHPAEDYDVSLSEDAGNKFIFSKIGYSTVSTHLSSLDVKNLLAQISCHLNFLRKLPVRLLSHWLICSIIHCNIKLCHWPGRDLI